MKPFKGHPVLQDVQVEFFLNGGVVFCVAIRALLFMSFAGGPDCWKLPCHGVDSRPPKAQESPINSNSPQIDPKSIGLINLVVLGL